MVYFGWLDSDIQMLSGLGALRRKEKVYLAVKQG